MKISVLQDRLAHGLSLVSRAVSPRSTLPVLSNILVATDDGRLRLSATNLELGITSWIGAKIEEEGSTTVPARTFTDLVSTIPPDKTNISLHENTETLNIQSGSLNTDIKCIDAQEFPPMPSPDLESGIEINVSDLKAMIRQVVFAASHDEARPILTGVLITIEEDVLTLAAADGFRLSVRSGQLSSPISAPVKAVIPGRALSELARISSDGSETVTMFLPPGRGQVIFRTDDTELVSQLIEGTFPDYQQIIPKNHQTRTIINAAQFLKACKQAEIFAREGSLIAQVKITPGDEEMTPAQVEITGQSEETGSSQSVLDATVEGPDLIVAFNVRYLREALDVINTPNVALETTKSTSPGVLRPVGGDDDFLHVIMPMHLGN